MELETLALAVDAGIATVTLTRGAQLNTMTEAFWTDVPAAFAAIDADPTVRAVVVASTGKHFTAGLDLNWAGQTLVGAGADAGRAREAFRRHVHHLQETFSAVDRCRVPVIACVQGGCIGGGVDFVTACDLRVGTADCFFTVQEINIAIVADVGTLQRIPHLLPQGLVRELAYTGRRFGAAEAKHYGFLNRVEADHAAALASAHALAAEIAAKSPLAITGIKAVLNHGRDATIAQGLDYVATWNAGMLQGDDLRAAMTAQAARTTPVFADLVA
ncbi:crotonase/enoyl-CoA hydratase family protein [Polymorphobacter sp. PAMC 29334]|uniref:crotonase/enoyl-CoA hydratase family protein n=1 Tax=Polymorphobacter sp. PAMC 29334 TaxID=2862331 RepID=UPI001C74CF7A|nr:crotonase/enoyl-CoA hydratase family protein [Polymorphobacter sp. PAMC 29334]QYE34833.1 crotonase/enoyl-CoA hydratase family protein [Polymorphobacter sp. PAMC 29334]